MFQKGTGERFKYKDAVKQKFPDAVCQKHSYTASSTPIVGFVVKTALLELSAFKASAEAAWYDAWLKNVK